MQRAVLLADSLTGSTDLVYKLSSSANGLPSDLHQFSIPAIPITTIHLVLPSCVYRPTIYRPSTSCVLAIHLSLKSTGPSTRPPTALFVQHPTQGLLTVRSTGPAKVLE